jgi:hypothetical protein
MGEFRIVTEDINDKDTMWALWNGIEALGILAAPKAYASRALSLPKPATVVRELLADWIAAARRIPECCENEKIKSAVPRIERLAAALPETFGEQVPRPIVAEAQALLALLDIPTPDEGWDEYDPPVPRTESEP